MSLSHTIGQTSVLFKGVHPDLSLEHMTAPTEMIQTAKDLYSGVRAHCVEFDLDASLASCNRLLRLLDRSSPAPTVGKISDLVNELRGRYCQLEVRRTRLGRIRAWFLDQSGARHLRPNKE